MASAALVDSPSLVHSTSAHPPSARRRLTHLPHVRDPLHRVAQHNGELWAAWTDNIPLHDLIAERAYFIWLDADRPHGHDLAHWLEAEHQLRREMALVEFGG